MERVIERENNHTQHSDFKAIASLSLHSFSQMTSTLPCGDVPINFVNNNNNNNYIYKLLLLLLRYGVMCVLLLDLYISTTLNLQQQQQQELHDGTTTAILWWIPVWIGWVSHHEHILRLVIIAIIN